MYRVSVTSGAEYTFKTGCGDGATASYDTYLELYNAGCTEVAINDDGCENFRSTITWIATDTGYAYLKVRGFNGAGGNYTLAYDSRPVSVEQIDEGVSMTYSLNQNYPNPFNPRTEIEFSLAASSKVKITVYDLLGNEVNRLVDQNLHAGGFRTTWDGTNSNGTQMSSGTYLCLLVATPQNGSQPFMQTRKLMLLK